MPQPVKLTDRFLEKYKPTSTRDEIFDKDGHGLGIRITPRSRVFFFVRRVKGQKVRLTLGAYPAMSLARARSEVHSLLDRIQRGEDPRADMRARKQAEAEQDENTFAHAVDRFLAEYAEGKKRPLSESTIRGYRLALQGPLTAKWSERPLTEITDREVVRAIDTLEASKRFASAQLFRSRLRKFFNWAIGKRLIRENPTRGVSLASVPSDFKRDRVLSLDELKAVLEVAKGLAGLVGGYVAMLILCGQRRQETSLMKWSDIDRLDGTDAVWRIPPENAKNRQAHSVPLSPESCTILRSMPRLGEHVFTISGKVPISAFSRVKRMLDAALAKANLEPCLHDLRRSVATGIADLGFAPHVVEMILNHVSGEKAGIAGLYNRSRYDSDCRRALAAWAKAITAEDTANVRLLREVKSP